MSLERMLVLVHEATLTGSPMNLLHFLRWVGTHTDTSIDIILISDGPLRQQFEQIGTVTLLDGNPIYSSLKTAQDGLLHLGSTRAWKRIADTRLRPQLRQFKDYDLIYANSIASSSLLPYLPPARRIVSHVHELQVALRSWRPEDYVRALKELPDAWIAVSNEVREMLINEFKLPSRKVLLHYESIDAHSVANRQISLREVEDKRRSLGIPSDAAVVLGAGTIDWRKGVDGFVQLASEVRRRSRIPTRFVWVGGHLEGTDWERIRSDVERTGSDHIIFAGLKQDPFPWFAMADIFALTSREDPFPLVCLEHGAMSVPVVSYRNGGIPELLAAAGPNSALGIIDYLDVGAMADHIVNLLEHESLRRSAGSQLRKHILSNHDVAHAAPLLYADLEAIAT